MAKAKILSKTTDLEAKTVTFTFSDESEQVLDLSGLTPEVTLHLALHGASQKVGDSAAGAGGESDPVGYAKAQIESVIKSLTEGKWTTRTPGGAPRTTALVEALAELRGTDASAMREFVESIDDDTKKALRAHPDVKAKMSEIRARKDAEAAKKGDVKSLDDLIG